MAGGLSTAPTHEKLSGYFGLPAEVQRKIGTFVLISSMVEQQLEVLAWAFKPKIISEKPVWTDKFPISDLISEISKLCQQIKDEGTKQQLLLVLAACNDMLTVRHTVVHGRLRGRTDTTGVLLARNDSILGEARKRERSVLSLKPDNLDQASHIMDRLFMAVSAFGAAVSGAPVAEFMLERLTDLDAIYAAARTMKGEALEA